MKQKVIGKHTLAILVALAAIALTACSGESPLSPSPLPAIVSQDMQQTMAASPTSDVRGLYSTASTTQNPANVHANHVVNGSTSDQTHAIFYVNGALGHVSVTNLSPVDHHYTFLMWMFFKGPGHQYTEANQLLVARYKKLVKAGATESLTVGVNAVCLATYQPELVIDEKSDITTINEMMNSKFIPPGALWYSQPGDCTGIAPTSPTVPVTPPVPPVPPTPPGPSNKCEVKAFLPISPNSMYVVGDMAYLPLTLAPGYDNVTVYFDGYGSERPFPSNQLGQAIDISFPQKKVYEQSFVIKAGGAQIISLPVARFPWLAWQNDVGCVKGPDVLLKRGDYPKPILEAAYGNNHF